jgi:hypothetical protein
MAEVSSKAGLEGWNRNSIRGSRKAMPCAPDGYDVKSRSIVGGAWSLKRVPVRICRPWLSRGRVHRSAVSGAVHADGRGIATCWFAGE